MANPNVLNATAMYGNTDFLAVTTTATGITTCPSGYVYKINSLSIANIDTTNSYEITVDVYRSSTAYHIAKNIAIPANATLVVLSKDLGFYLKEGDVLRLTASDNGFLEAACSYDIVTEAV